MLQTRDVKGEQFWPNSQMPLGTSATRGVVRVSYAAWPFAGFDSAFTESGCAKKAARWRRRRGGAPLRHRARNAGPLSGVRSRRSWELFGSADVSGVVARHRAHFIRTKPTKSPTAKLTLVTLNRRPGLERICIW